VLRPLFIEMKRLRVELPGEGDDVVLRHRDGAVDRAVAGREILEVQACH
jgi:hypothetical protein